MHRYRIDSQQRLWKGGETNNAAAILTKFDFWLGAEQSLSLEIYNFKLLSMLLL